jgi:hypothetical protein
VRRLFGWMSGNETWTGSWGERVEALVEYLHGPEYQLRRRRNAADGENTDENAETFGIIASNVFRRRAPEDRKLGKATPSEETKEWKAVDQLPVKQDRRETRCCMCWVPALKPSYSLGLAYEPRLSLERCCTDCQQEEAEKRLRRREREDVVAAGHRRGQEHDEAIEAMRTLFGPLGHE